MNVKNLSKRYKTDNGETVVLDNFDIAFEDGKTTAVMGGSGIGKTTLLNCIAKLTDYDGEITGAGDVAYVFQSDRLLPNKTVFKNVEFVVFEPNAEKRKKRVVDALRLTELENEAGKFPSELSGGQKKRVSLAMAVASGRKTLLLDEPLSSLDLGLKFRIYEVLKRIFTADKKTVIMVTHDIGEALTLADEIVVIGGNGVKYRKKISDSVFGRDITNKECNEIRKDLINIFKGLK